MESLIGLVNRIQRACTVLGDHGGADGTLPTLWEALPSVAVVGGQVLNTPTSLPSRRFFVQPLNPFVRCVSWWAEFGEIVGIGEHRWARFSAPWFWLGFGDLDWFCTVLLLRLSM